MALTEEMEPFVVERSSIRERFDRNEFSGLHNYAISERSGEGFARLLASVNRIQITDFEMKFHQELNFESVSYDEYVDLFFCLGEGVQWKVEGRERPLDFDIDESLLLHNVKGKDQCLLQSGRLYRFMGVKILPDTFRSITTDICREEHLQGKAGMDGMFGKYPLTPSVKTILQQIRSCPYERSLRNVYMEGKIFELLATYIAEAVWQSGSTRSMTNLSKQDMDCICKAKEMLDRQLSVSISLNDLSRKVGLNEFKLKKGFKQMFGISVHAYLIHRRLETARLLFEETGMSVSEVAYQVGYGNLSYFTLSFRNKFGINPGEYARLCVKRTARTPIIRS